MAVEWALEAYEMEGPEGVRTQASRMSILEWVTGADAAMRHAYWQWCDLRGSVMLGESILTLAMEEGSTEILGAAKPAIANLATWTWPGWDEPYRRPTGQMLRLGMSAADLNLDLAGRLEKPPIAVSRALWVVAAHWMVKDIKRAVPIFEEAADRARDAEADVDALMNQCYAWACSRNSSLGGGLADLETRGEDGAFYAGQIRTALKVFQLPWPT